MRPTKNICKVLATICAVSLTGCGFGGKGDNSITPTVRGAKEDALPTSSIWDLFDRGSENDAVAVNRYIWAASLEVLNFLPIQSVDPFTGVIATGYGTPPGGGRAYRATVLVDDPALDARSLNVALQTRGGSAVSKATSRAVEDAILSRARELRIADNKF